MVFRRGIGGVRALNRGDSFSSGSLLLILEKPVTDRLVDQLQACLLYIHGPLPKSAPGNIFFFSAGMETLYSEFIDCRITDIVAVLFQFLPPFFSKRGFLC